MSEAPHPARSGRRPVEIRAERIAKSFDGHRVLRGVALEVRREEIVAIVGASGCGKTVLLHILTGLLRPDEGRVLVANHAAASAPLVELTALDEEARDEVRLAWAVVFQKNALFSATVFENCALWLREHTDLSLRQIRERVRASLEAVSLDVDTVVTKHRDELSGGMAKRVAVARALAQDPLVLFYDEPTTGLDPVNSWHIHDLIWNTHLEPRSDGARRTTVLVTHDRDLLRRLHPRVVMLHQGAVCFDGPYETFSKVREGPAHEYLMAMPVLHARPQPHGEEKRPMQLKIGVLASHGGSNMQAIIDHIEAGALDARIAVVISNNSTSGAIERAQRHGLPWRHLSSQTHPDPAELDEAICRTLQEAGVDCVVLAGYMKKIGRRTLDAFDGRILNIHPALLPRHGGQGMYGIRPHEAVLAAGERESGASVHVVTAEYDQGPVLRQRRVSVESGDTPQTLQRRVLAQEHEIYSEVIADIVAGRIPWPVPRSWPGTP